MRSPRTTGKALVRPRRRLGQCFLQDHNIARKIVALAELRPGDTVVEIGAGQGVMTALIAPQVRRVVAVEIDRRLVDVLHELPGSRGNIDIVHQDVLTFDLARVAEALETPKLKVIGNIPYHISTPILFHLLGFRRVVSCAVLMVQKEVAQRIAAGPGTKDYGIPSVLIAAYAQTASVLTVPPSCFYPEPKVISAVLRIDFRPEPLAPIEDERFFRDVVRTAFANRRKTLMNNLRRNPLFHVTENDLERLFEAEGLDLKIRAEALAPERFISLANRLRPLC